MTKQAIPIVGDELSDGFPSIEKIVKCTFGALKGDVITDTSGTHKICSIAPYTQVTDVGWMVETKFGNDVAITIGDTGDPNGWAETGDVTASVADATIYWASITGLATKAPRYALASPIVSDSEEHVSVVVSTSFSSQAEGELAIYVKYHMAYAQKHF
jgi:hypothetical protein